MEVGKQPTAIIKTYVDQNKIIDFDTFILQSWGKYRNPYIPNLALMIGAGASYSETPNEGVILGNQVIDLLKILCFSKMNEVPIRLNAIHLAKIFAQDAESKFREYVFLQENKFKTNIDSSFKEYLTRIPNSLKNRIDTVEGANAWELIKNYFYSDLLYCNWFEEYSEHPKERQEFIEALIDGKLYNGAYFFLANIIRSGIFNIIYTTNFDDFVNESYIYETFARARVYANNESAAYIRFHDNKAKIIKLHGDYLFQDIRNSIEETSTLHLNFDYKLKECLKSFGLVVCGYNGSDYSVMKILEESKIENNFPLYWCGLNPANVNWRVAELINTYENNYFIKINSFDEFVFKIWQKNGCGSLGETEKIKRVKLIEARKQNVIQSFKERISNEIQDKKQILKDDIQKDLWQHYLNIKEANDIQDLAEISMRIDSNNNLYDFFMGAAAFFKGISTGNPDNFLKSLKYLNRIIKKDNFQYFPYVAKGLSLYYLGHDLESMEHCKEAIETFHIILENTPNANGVRTYLARCYSVLGNNLKEIKILDKAITQFEIVFKNDSKDLGNLCDWATALLFKFNLNDNYLIIKEVDKLIEIVKSINPSYDSAYRVNCKKYLFIYLSSNKNEREILEQANSEITSAFKINPLDSQTLHLWGYTISLLAFLTSDKLKYREAISKLEQSIQLSPFNPNSYNRLAFIYSKLILLGSVEYDINDIEIAIKTSLSQIPKNNKYIQTLANALYEIGTYKKDENYLQLAVKEYLKLADSESTEEKMNDIGLCYYELSKLGEDKSKYLEKALKYFQIAINIDKKYHFGYFNIANCILEEAKVKYDEDKLNEAIKYYNKTIELSPTFYDAYINSGFCYGLIRNKTNNYNYIDVEIRLFSKAIEIDNKSTIGYFNRAVTYHCMGMKEKIIEYFKLSIKDYETLIQIEKANLLAMQNLGTNYYFLGELEFKSELIKRAHECFETVVLNNKLNDQVFYNWGDTLVKIYYLNRNSKYLYESIDKSLKAEELSMGKGAYNISCAYALLDEKEKAIEWLEKSIKFKNVTINTINNDDDFKLIRETKEFQSLLKIYFS